MKIALAGPAGTGKSKVAESISNEKGILFLRAKEITNPILKRDGYDYSSGMKVEKFLQTIPRQMELLKKTKEMQSVSMFITDRCFVDLAAYALSSSETLDTETIDKIVSDSKTYCLRYSHIYLFKLGKLLDNQKRTLCRNYQEMIYMLELGLLTDWGIPFTIIENNDLDPVPKVQRIINDVWTAVKQDAH